MKARERARKDVVVVQSPAYEDSGLATSGELGEQSFSGECEDIACLPARDEVKGIDGDPNRDPRSDIIIDIPYRLIRNFNSFVGMFNLEIEFDSNEIQRKLSNNRAQNNRYIQGIK